MFFGVRAGCSLNDHTALHGEGGPGQIGLVGNPRFRQRSTGFCGKNIQGGPVPRSRNLGRASTASFPQRFFLPLSECKVAGSDGSRGLNVRLRY